MKHSLFRGMVAVVLTFSSASSSWAVVAQAPLLSNTVLVKPNIALVLDTSGSMDWECVYAKQVTDAFIAGGVTNMPGLTTDCLGPTDRRQASPVNNLLFYNPKTTYVRSYSATGTLNAAATVDSTSVVTLYLPKAGQDPTTYTTSAALTNAANYDGYEVNATKFVLNGGTATSTNIFGAHGGSRTDCAAATCTHSEERKNIANWRAYHYDRLKAAKTGIGGAFISQADNFRLAYTTIYASPNTMTDFGVAKTSFYNWLDGRVASGGTPLRDALKKAGTYYKSIANNGPWGSKPWSPPSGETSASHLSCRRSYTLLITDGFYTDSMSGYGNVDATTGPTQTLTTNTSKVYTYVPGDTSDIRNRGKSDNKNGTGGTSNTLADIALYYWETDLRGDLLNDVGGGGPSDPPFWQNMTSYMVSFGAPGKMTDAEVASAKLGSLNWAIPVSNTVTTIDDMRHAAHNGGGDFLTVSNAAQFATDLGNVIGSIAGQQFSQAGVAASAVTLTAGTKKFVPYYTSGTWWGNVQMINLSDGSVGWEVISTDANGQPTGTTTLPTPTTRKIVVWVDGTKQAVDFNFTNITAGANNLRGTNAKMQMSNAVTSDIIDFLRGVRTKEGVDFRKRQAVLGDVVNSIPAFIKNNTNPQYENLPSGTAGLSQYAAYMTAKAARTEGVLFVGANDGMLHAFGEGYGSSVGGRELFAYIPRSVLGKLEALTTSGYTFAHSYTVDGPLVETDAYVTTPNLTTSGSSTGWRNLVLGSTGAGAKSVFALNASNPLGMNSKAVLWEINPDPAFPVLSGNTSTSFAELGHVLSQVQSGITVSGDWVSIFGNGYDSLSGKASLYIVETATGRLLKQIPTDAVTGNGLGGVRLVLNSNQQIIGAYAGDLKGRLWKFDLSSTGSAGWGLGNGGVALFTALSGATPLPITSQPAVVTRTDQPSYSPSYMVTVATGKLFEAADPTITTPNQAVYGLWDRKAFGSTGSDTINEVDLERVQETLVNNPLSASGGPAQFLVPSYFNATVTAINWSTRRGWKNNFDISTLPGQRNIYPINSYGDIVKIDTVTPDSSVSSCKATMSNALTLAIDPLTGLCRVGGTLDTNQDGSIDGNDQQTQCGYSSLADGIDVVLIVLNAKNEDTGLRSVQNSGGQDVKIRVRDTPPDCTDPAYAAAHTAECCVGAACGGGLLHPGSTLNRSWRQLFPRANL